MLRWIVPFESKTIPVFDYVIFYIHLKIEIFFIKFVEDD